MPFEWPNLSLDMSFIELILNASLLVQMVMLLLLLMSLWSWFLIFRKRRCLRKARRQALRFEDSFWRGRDLSALYAQLSIQEEERRGLESIFGAGYNEFMRLRKQAAIPPLERVQGAQRAMRVALSREIDELDSNLNTLATIGSVSPYIGLFGTVWGIMHSFHSLADVQQATIQMVAPGISEALIATAMGLFAAIPAVMAYNNYVTEVERLAGRFAAFQDEFTSILQRQAHMNTNK